ARALGLVGGAVPGGVARVVGAGPPGAARASGSEMDAVATAAPAISGVRHQVRVRDLGRQAYEPVWRAMSALTDRRGPDTPDEFWLVEHDPVFTLGQAGRDEHVLMPGDIPVIHVD